MTTPLIPYYDTLTIERDPADDSFAAVIRNDFECRACGERLADLDHPLCELCRHAVADEGDL
jgi:hypothetical protein